MATVNIHDIPVSLAKLRFPKTDTKTIIALDPDFCDWTVPHVFFDHLPTGTDICLQTTSFSWLDTMYARQKGIRVMNIRDWSTNAVAEWAFLMAQNLARRIPLVISDGWKKDYVKHQGIELFGKTAGIIGLGHIGTRLAEIAEGHGMRVQYWSKHSRDPRFSFVELEELMKTSDVIFPTVAQNTETIGLISDSLLYSMKPTAIFASIISQNVYDHAVALKLAKCQKIYGYGFEASKSTRITYKGNIWAGPALAWVTKEAEIRNAEHWIQAIIEAISGTYPTQVTM